MDRWNTAYVKLSCLQIYGEYNLASYYFCSYLNILVPRAKYSLRRLFFMFVLYKEHQIISEGLALGMRLPIWKSGISMFFLRGMWKVWQTLHHLGCLKAGLTIFTLFAPLGSESKWRYENG